MKIQLLIEFRSSEERLFLAEMLDCLESHQWVAISISVCLFVLVLLS